MTAEGRIKELASKIRRGGAALPTMPTSEAENYSPKDRTLYPSYKKQCPRVGHCGFRPPSLVPLPSPGRPRVLLGVTSLPTPCPHAGVRGGERFSTIRRSETRVVVEVPSSTSHEPRSRSFESRGANASAACSPKQRQRPPLVRVAATCFESSNEFRWFPAKRNAPPWGIAGHAAV